MRLELMTGNVQISRTQQRQRSCGHMHADAPDRIALTRAEVQ